MTEEDVKRHLAELCIKGIGYMIEDEAKKEEDSLFWDIVDAVGKDMKNNPERYYDLGELLYNKYKVGL